MTRADHLRLSIVFALARAKVRVGRTHMKPELTDEQRDQVVKDVIEHLRLSDRIWSLDDEVEPPPVRRGIN